MEPVEQKPWLDSNNKLLGDAAIKEISKEWNSDTWERFLEATVDKQPVDHEVLVNGYADLLEEQIETLWGGHSALPEPVHEEINRAVRTLETIPRMVVRGIYWRGLPQTTIARKLEISQPRVSRIKNLSLSNIRELLEVEVIVASYLLGGSANLGARIKSRDQELFEIYSQDLNGSYLK